MPRHISCATRVLVDDTLHMKGLHEMQDTQQPAAEAQQTFFRITDNVPEEAWYWAALGSIGISAMLKLASKDDWAIFVGQWPPTFLLFGLYHRLIRPSRH